MKSPKLLLLAMSLVLLTACDDEPVAPSTPTTCNTGTLRCSNTSLHTVQRILVSGTNYGTIDPGETRNIELAPGNWTLRFVGISGGQGCSESTFNIASCQTISRSCSY